MTNKEALFRQWYADYSPSLRKYVFHLVGRDRTDDVVQECFLKVWRAMDQFENAAQPKTWIHRIAHNAAIDVLRKVPLVLVEDIDVPSSTLRVNQQSDESASQPELADLIAKGIASLSETLRPAFILHYQVGLSIHEVAAIIEVPEGTVKTRLLHAREKFGAFLRAGGVDHDL